MHTPSSLVIDSELVAASSVRFSSLDESGSELLLKDYHVSNYLKNPLPSLLESKFTCDRFMRLIPSSEHFSECGPVSDWKHKYLYISSWSSFCIPNRTGSF